MDSMDLYFVFYDYLQDMFFFLSSKTNQLCLNISYLWQFYSFSVIISYKYYSIQSFGLGLIFIYSWKVSLKYVILLPGLLNCEIDASSSLVHLNVTNKIKNKQQLWSTFL